MVTVFGRNLSPFFFQKSLYKVFSSKKTLYIVIFGKIKRSFFFNKSTKNVSTWLKTVSSGTILNRHSGDASGERRPKLAPTKMKKLIFEIV